MSSGISSDKVLSKVDIGLVRPFAGLLPRPDLAQGVAAPPYDVVSTAEARALARGNEWSFLHVSKPEIDFPADTDPYDPAVYAKGGENMRRMIDADVIRRQSEPGYYVYRVTDGDHVQTGLAVAGSVKAYNANRIRRHEVTRPEKEDDRVRQIEAVNAHTGPIFAVHHTNATIAGQLAAVTALPALIDVEAADGSRHAIWPVSDPAVVANLSGQFDALEAIYIADGHHRSAAAARVAAQRAADDSSPREDAPYNSFLLVCFPEDQARILGYHRLVRDLNGMTPDQLIERLERAFPVKRSDAAAQPSEAGRFGMYLDGAWYDLDLRDAARSAGDAVARLDVSVLADRILGPVLGIGDPRTDPRIDFSGGRDAPKRLKDRVDSGEMAVAFTVHPMRMADLFAVADAGAIMPPKSTWFDPKLLDGLVSYPLD